MKSKDDSSWFENWFNSPYYHVLYKERNNSEAEAFILNLINYLNPIEDSIFLDTACGKGRHSIYLNTLGYTVDGFDLSENNVNEAKKFITNNLNFYINDVRTPLKINHYNYVFNIFTSFGYFEDEIENQITINAFADSLIKNGVLILDFMNCNKIIQSLKKDELKTIDGIEFKIKKEYTNNFIIKNIEFTDKDIIYKFQEKVKAIMLNDFKLYFAASNLKIEAIFGDYELNPFDLEKSERLILVARKL